MPFVPKKRLKISRGALILRKILIKISEKRPMPRVHMVAYRTGFSNRLRHEMKRSTQQAENGHHGRKDKLPGPAPGRR